MKQLIQRFVFLCMMAAVGCWAQVRVEVSGVGLSQVPIAVPVFKGQGQLPHAINEIIQADLERTGQFSLSDIRDIVGDDTTRPDFAIWKQKSVDALVAGSVISAPDGRYEIRVRLWDVVKGVDLGSKTFPVVAADLRLGAHQAADYIYEKLTGDKGVFATHIAYVTKSGSRYTLWVSDSDGQGAVPALVSGEPIISPSWSPRNEHLAYVSFEGRKPVVYTHRIKDGKRHPVGNFKGSNSSPAWSPNGAQMALTLSRDGGSQIFLMDLAGAGLKRLSQSSGIDTEAAFSADGQHVYFVSDRGGSPQIYRMPVAGGAAERMTFTGNYNISPAPSPDGKYLAYISRISGNDFRLHVLELATGKITPLTSTSFDERPTFSPNSKLVLYLSKIEGKTALMTVALDGKLATRLDAVVGDIREPAWGRFFN